MHQHIIFLAKNCSATPLQDRSGAVKLLDTLQPPSGILDKKILTRPNGLVAYYFAEHEHLVLTTNPQQNEAFVDIRSRRPIDQIKCTQALQAFTKTSFTNILSREFTNNDYESSECQEPRCTRAATRDYHGIKVCRDHYEIWLEREQEEQKYKEFS